jgi:hypothetical protein
MICPDCAAAADYEALPGLQKVVRMLDGDAEGHDRCFRRNLGAEAGSEDCACQHRSPVGSSEVTDGR